MRVALLACFLGLVACTSGTGPIPPFVLPPPIIGCKPLTCITFDEPLLDWKCDFIASKGLFLKNFGVEIRKNCGLCGDCGQFVRPSKIELPFFKNHDFFDFSVSVWFKRRGANGCMPVVVSNGDCDQAAVQVSSVDANTLVVTVRACTGLEYTQTFQTDDQCAEWRHVVVTVHVDKVSEWGWAKVYIDGRKRGQGHLDGRMPPIWFPMFIGGKGCGVCDRGFFNGFMDSISFARYAPTDREIRALYESRGQCIGE
ncbi:hypothetical protein NP493_1562g00009 [Ridgeia piscesae]|uniref:LamG domain-containing protein n=1 Tax=Ridgeia piscesae TaxID=27915 RepID=A0AAD9JZE4_RIDPI|nr:hypothetical protein NP493_1562g00009 [Ridgeia piscesae]